MEPGPDGLTAARDLALLLLVLVACWTDVRTRKIKNWLTFPSAAAGVVLSGLAGPPWAGVVGLFGVLLVCLPLWRVGPVLSAGDVKMLAAAGALLGLEDGLRALLWTLAFGLPAGLVALALLGRLGKVREVVRGKAPPTMLWHAPVIGAGIAAARLQDWPALF